MLIVVMMKTLREICRRKEISEVLRGRLCWNMDLSFFVDYISFALP